MVMTISPRFAGRSEKSGGTATLVPFTIAAAASGAAVFGVSGWIGGAVLESTPASVAVLLAAGVAAMYGVSYLFHRPLPVPRSSRQVPKLWREAFSPRTAAALYGVGLGVGFFTRVPYLTFYAALLMAFFSREPGSGAVAGIVFGLARAAPLALYRLRREPLGRADELVRGIVTTHRRRIEIVNGTALLALGLVLWVIVAG